MLQVPSKKRKHLISAIIMGVQYDWDTQKKFAKNAQVLQNKITSKFVIIKHHFNVCNFCF